jgi:hypothetical protein
MTFREKIVGALRQAGLRKCGPTSTRRLRNKSAGAITTCPFTSHASPSTTRPRGPIAAGVAESLLGIAIGLRVPVSSRDGIVTSTVSIAHYLANGWTRNQ